MKKQIFAAILFIFIILAVGAMILMSTVEKDKETGLLDIIEGYQGYSRVISEEELEFYSYFVERDLSEGLTEEELERLVQDYAQRVNASFYLGNRLGLCEPYSFETLKLRLEQENSERQAKLAQNEVIYGVEQFTLQTYFQYTMDNLQAALMSYLEENADKEIRNMAEAYYEAHKEEFRNRNKVVYEQTMDEQTEIMTADADMLSYLGKTDPGLADFLGIAQIGDVYRDETDYKQRTIVLKEIIYSEEGYENNAQMALYRFVRNELYDTVLTKVIENNPAEFE